MGELEVFRWGVDILLVALATVMWFLMRKLIADVEAIGKTLADYKLHVAENYVTQNGLGKAIDNFTGQVDNIFKKLERIEDKLDGKADKVRA